VGPYKLAYLAEQEWPYSAYNILRPTQPVDLPDVPTTRAYTTVAAGLNTPKPYSSKLPSTTTLKSAALITAVDAFVLWVQNELRAGRTVIVSIPVYQNFDTYDVLSSGTVPMPRGQMIGGHAIALVGYTPSSSRFNFVNSWGTYTGIGGHFTIPYEYIGRFAAEAFSL